MSTRCTEERYLRSEEGLCHESEHFKERHFETLNIKRKARPFSKSFVSPHCEKKKKKNTLIKNNTWYHQ